MEHLVRGCWRQEAMGDSITVTDAGPQQGGQIEEPKGRQRQMGVGRSWMWRGREEGAEGVFYVSGQGDLG